MYKIHIGSDHAGLNLKNLILAELNKQNIQIEDHGTDNYNSCDYPNFAHSVCQGILNDKASNHSSSGQSSFGILICGTGMGMSMAANRHKGIRAALCACEFHARAARSHNDANVICLGERVSGPGLAIDMVNIFLNTPFEHGRHEARVKLIDNI